jgi:mono/diheme cytochrome c family protein
MRLLLFVPAGILAVTLAVAGNAVAQAPPPAGEGLDVIKARCVSCHPINQILDAPPKTAQNWAQTVRKMAERNGEMTPEEITVVNDYLAKHFAVDGPVAAAQPPSPVAKH